MAHRPRLDDPAVLEALLTQYSAPDDLAAKLKSAGYNTLSALVFAAPDVADEPQLLRSLLSLPAPTELTTPACSAVRRLLMEARLLLPGVPPSLPAATSAAPSAPMPSQPAVPKLSTAELSQLRTDFMAAYPGELLNSATTPCLEMCAAIKHLHDSACSPWLPWRQRASEADRAAWSESRRPRSDGQLLRALLSDEFEAPAPTSAAGLNGPLESVLRRNLSLFATALAMTKITHLITIKRFTEKFISTALAVPPDPSLRPPTLNEILAADRAVWISVHELVRDHSWSLEDALNEISTCRQDISALLQPRPRTSKAHADPNAPNPRAPNNRRPDRSRSARNDEARKHAPKSKGRGRGKDRSDASSSVPGFDAAWFQKIGKRELCKRYALGKCSNPNCRYAHLCPLPLPSGKPCGQKHTVAEHKNTAY